MPDVVRALLDIAASRPDLLALAAFIAMLTSIVVTVASSMARRRHLKRRLTVNLPVSRRDAPGEEPGDDPLSTLGLGPEGSRLPPTLEKFIAQANSIVSGGDAGKMKIARQRMIRAGLFSPHAVALFFLARLAGAIAAPATALLLLTVANAMPETTKLLVVLLVSAIVGYLGPSFYVDRRAKTVLRQNRIAFPDFMDLMGVCANAGLSMEASLERVTQELAPMYPALGVNLEVLCLEVRAGRSMELALQTLADRVGVPEVRAFATLLQQSRELGSSLSDALRVFAEDMRHQRLAAAEEKAYALPAKLSVPVTACILPVVLFIAIWPMVVKFNS
ncbi:type II secretion protein F [Pleomorphomonas diazotrophica]|uniref:Type II secretion protein F n=1 Tax=Pleomorphomonas diazotrophica TaxID=1166257 RepID=A0A1I4TGM0_9HYPH|nr:type II secretion system F family protein [Pleomorphomonas diazotrophica]PKR87235.1 type II secretion protein F [Pleomorphomonas diazotrophica]SFM75707.1 tight adherence protein C [Pleomorphomonas diazotrophica]